MATYYFDTSAVVKLYVPEPGTDWVDAIVEEKNDQGQPENVVAFSEVAIVEVAAAVARRQRTGDIEDNLAEALFGRFTRDCRDRFFTLAVRDDVIQRATVVARDQHLRAYDALHLGTALVLDELLITAGLPRHVFVSADRRLLDAAVRERLLVAQPAEAEA